MRKFWNRFIVCLLLILVATSLVLTFLIFRRSIIPLRANDGESPLLADDVNVFENQEATEGEVEELSHSFGADSVVYYTNGVFQKAVDPEILDTLNGDLRNLLGQSLTAVGKEQSVGDFHLAIADQSDYVELEFSQDTPFTAYRGAAQDDDDENALSSDRTFNRLGYLASKQQFYVINDIDDSVLTFEAPDKMQTWLSTIKDHLDSFTTVDQVILKGRTIYLQQDKQTVPLLRYIMDQRSNSDLLNTFFEAHEEVHDYSDAQISRYYADKRNMTIDNNTLEVEFRNEGDEAQQRQIATEAEKNLRRIHSAGQSWHFDDRDRATRSDIFRQMIGGIPIFGDRDVSKISITLESEGTLSIKFSKLSVQTPISDLSVDYDLPAGKDVLLALNSNGYANDSIEDLMIGYFWQPSTASDRLIDLVPTWLVAIDGQYQTLDNVLDLAQYPQLRTVTTADGQIVDTNLAKKAQ